MPCRWLLATRSQIRRDYRGSRKGHRSRRRAVVLRDRATRVPHRRCGRASAAHAPKPGLPAPGSRKRAPLVPNGLGRSPFTINEDGTLIESNAPMPRDPVIKRMPMRSTAWLRLGVIQVSNTAGISPLYPPDLSVCLMILFVLFVPFIAGSSDILRSR